MTVQGLFLFHPVMRDESLCLGTIYLSITHDWARLKRDLQIGKCADHRAYHLVWSCLRFQKTWLEEMTTIKRSVWSESVEYEYLKTKKPSVSLKFCIGLLYTIDLTGPHYESMSEAKLGLSLKPPAKADSMDCKKLFKRIFTTAKGPSTQLNYCSFALKLPLSSKNRRQL